MAIYRLIANGSFGPDEIKVMTDAYERALIDLSVAERDDQTRRSLPNPFSSTG